MNKLYIFIIFIVVIVLGYFTGTYIYKINNMGEETTPNYVAEVVDDECVIEGELYENGELKEVLSEEEKLSPNAIISIEKYYKDCGHTVKTRSVIDTSLVNLTKEDLQNKYEAYEVTSFSPAEAILYIELEGSCKEHYIVKEVDGYVTIYEIDDTGRETLKQTTEIETDFLTITDKANLESGILVYGNDSLNSLLEDFE
ncbi:MAG: BofC C-terminal domain-containing protein [Lachnospiraceae bacterium]|nr:BofC C-terminal domain-containing protein [Lachnospiraceae bacterium]